MEETFSVLAKNISIIDRLMKMYYNRGLADFGCGWGHQFYIEYLYDHPGAYAQEIAALVRVDKATLTKVVKELSQMGCVTVVVDEADRRIRRLYLTEEAIPVAKQIKRIHSSFNQALREGITEEDLQTTEAVLSQIVENLNQKVWHRMERERFGKE